MLINSEKINKSKASIYNLIFAYASSIIQVINSILLLPLYLSYFSLADYGAYVAASAILHIFLIIDPGLSTATTTRLSQAFVKNEDIKFNSLFLSGLILAAIFAIIIILFGFLLNLFIPEIIFYDGDKSNQLDLALIICVFGISLNPIVSVQQSFYQSVLRTFEGNVILVSSVILSPFAIILCLYNDLGIASLPTGLLITNISALIVNTILIPYYLAKTTDAKFFVFKNISLLNLFSDIKYLYLKRFSNALADNFETSIAGILFNTQVAGAFAIMKKLFQSIQLFSNAIATSAFSSMSHIFEQNDKSRLKSSLKKTIYASDLIQVFGISALFLAFKPFLFLWLGQEINLGYIFMILLALSSILSVKSILLYSMLTSNGLFKETSFIYIIDIIVRVAGTYILVKLISLFALPIAASIGSIITLILFTKILKEKSNITLIEALISLSYYELFICSICIIAGYFIPYPNNFNEALMILVFTMMPFLFFMAIGKNFQEFVIELYKSYKS
jgi:O-antigen/teichoic acid export membrane protein